MKLIVPIIKDNLCIDLSKYKLEKVLLFSHCSDQFIDQTKENYDYFEVNRKISFGNLINKTLHGNEIIFLDNFEVPIVNNQDIILSDKYVYISENAVKQIGLLDGWFPYTCEIEDYCLRASLKGLKIEFKIPFDSFLNYSKFSFSHKNFSKQFLYIKYSLPQSLPWNKVFNEVNRVHSWSEQMFINA